MGGTDVMDSCRHLSSRLFASKAEFHPIFDFLSSLHSNGKRLMLNESISTFEEMGSALTKAEKLLENMDAEVQIPPVIWCTSHGRHWCLEKLDKPLLLICRHLHLGGSTRH